MHNPGIKISLDVDECETDHLCDPNASCSNTVGTYYCTCNEGYYGSGRRCALVICESCAAIGFTAESDWSYPGESGESQVADQASFSDCVNVCKVTNNCIAVTYTSATNTCWVKPSSNNGVVSTGRISGRDCTTVPECNQGKL